MINQIFVRIHRQWQLFCRWKFWFPQSAASCYSFWMCPSDICGFALTKMNEKRALRNWFCLTVPTVHRVIALEESAIHVDIPPLFVKNDLIKFNTSFPRSVGFCFILCGERDRKIVVVMEALLLFARRTSHALALDAQPSTKYASCATNQLLNAKSIWTIDNFLIICLTLIAGLHNYNHPWDAINIGVFAFELNPQLLAS